MKNSTKENYINRIDRVMDFLNGHIEQAPSLEKLAHVAAISPFHFHRVYRALTGETPSATLRRLRLAKACLLLKENTKPVTEIAFDVGYDSSQAFAKALREMTGSTASELRNDPDKLAETAIALSSPPGNNAGETPVLDVKLISIQPFKVIAHRHKGPHDGLFKAFGHLFSWAQETGRAANFRGIYGVPVDDPRDIPDNDCRFDCCFDLGPDATANHEFREVLLGGGNYAVLRHKGPYDGLQIKYDYLYGTWLSSSGCTLREQSVYNHYLADPDTLPPEKWETDIYLPVE